MSPHQCQCPAIVQPGTQQPAYLGGGAQGYAPQSYGLPGPVDSQQYESAKRQLAQSYYVQPTLSQAGPVNAYGASIPTEGPMAPAQGQTPYVVRGGPGMAPRNFVPYPALPGPGQPVQFDWSHLRYV